MSETGIVSVGIDVRMPVLRENNVGGITEEEVQEAVEGIKACRGWTMLRSSALVQKGGITVIEWFVKLLNVCSCLVWVGPINWGSVCITTLYRDRKDKYDCSNSLFRMQGKRIIDSADGAIGK